MLVNYSSFRMDLLGSAAGNLLDQLDVGFDGAGNGMAEVTINAAGFLAAQVCAPGPHTHQLPIFGQAEALGGAFVCF